MSEFEKRFYNFEIRANEADGETILQGRPIVYNSQTDLGWYDELIAPHALDNTDLTDVRFLVNHDTDMIPLARSRRNNGGKNTMQMSIDELGLNLDWVKLDTANNTTAAALASAVRRGDISGMSFMFTVKEDEWANLETEHPTRTITKIGSVIEVSAVTFPAYDATEIYARSKEALDNARSALEKARQQSAKPVETGLELAKEHLKLLGGTK